MNGKNVINLVAPEKRSRMAPVCDNKKCRFHYIQCEEDAMEIGLQRSAADTDMVRFGRFRTEVTRKTSEILHPGQRQKVTLTLCECCFEAVRMAQDE